MKKIATPFWVVSGICIATSAALAIEPSAALAEDSSATTKPSVERGAYLVNHFGQCADCHTARDQTGAFVESAWLMGAPIMFKPTVPMPVWADVALPIAGLPTFADDESAIQFLMTGLKPDGQMSRPPMPAFRLNRQDAEDAVAYLRSLAHPVTPAE